MITGEHLAQVMVRITDTLADDLGPVEFLQLFTSHSALMSESLWAGLLLADSEGRLRFTAASTESVELSQLFELDQGEGPWLDCFRTGAPVVDADLAQVTDRWPTLVPRAVAAGFRSVSALPLRGSTDVVIGTLNLFSSDRSHLAPRDVRIIQAIADLATIGLLRERRASHGVAAAAGFQRSLTTSIASEQAKGVLARTQGVSVDDAAHLMDGYASRHQQEVHDVAGAVLADPDLIEATDGNALYTPAEVAAMFRVDPKTITRWAKSGQLAAVKTLGGHRRYRRSEVVRLLGEA